MSVRAPSSASVLCVRWLVRDSCTIASLLSHSCWRPDVDQARLPVLSSCQLSADRRRRRRGHTGHGRWRSMQLLSRSGARWEVFLSPRTRSADAWSRRIWWSTVSKAADRFKAFEYSDLLVVSRRVHTLSSTSSIVQSPKSDTPCKQTSSRWSWQTRGVVACASARVVPWP